MALLEVEGATVKFGGLTAVSDVAFQVEAGTVRALIGPNGAGKTTLFRAIAGEERLSEGSVRFQGEPIHTLTPHEVAARGVRRTFQNGGLFGDLTALENNPGWDFLSEVGRSSIPQLVVFEPDGDIAWISEWYDSEDVIQAIREAQAREVASQQ